MDARRRALADADAQCAARAAAAHLVADPAFGAARRVALYAAYGGELSMAALAASVRAEARPVLWPRMEAGGGLALAEAFTEELVPDAYGIPSPPADRPETALGEGDLVLVPGLAFDAAGRRLGRGGGHYDRLIAAAGEGARFVGAGYGFQCVPEVPAGGHDQCMNGVLTEDGLRWIAQDREEPLG